MNTPYIPEIALACASCSDIRFPTSSITLVYLTTHRSTHAVSAPVSELSLYFPMHFLKHWSDSLHHRVGVGVGVSGRRMNERMKRVN